MDSQDRRTFMLNRRRAVQTGLAAMGALATPSLVRAQKKLVKIRYNEVVRSVLYAPAYVALSKGFFEEAGFDISIATANGGDKAIAALIGGAADIALIGPEAAIYVLTSESPVKPRIFCGLTSTDGFMLVGRKKVDKFDWNMLKGAEVLGFRPGSTPILFFEAAMRQNGIDPYKDLKLVNNVGIAARVGSWLAGQNQYAIFNEPEAAQLELDGKAFFLASIGETVGFADYTAFQATDKYIHDNPDILQRWTDAIAKAMKWTAAAPPADVAKVLEPYFPGVSLPALTLASERYNRLKIWKTTPVIEPAAIEKFQDILVQGHVLDPAKRVKFADLVLPEYASKAK
jgi:NitT/TauT family transport system substrate-binding protein